MSDYQFRHAICNEVFQGWKFHEACKKIREIGYTGIEIAPFTLSEDPATITADERRQYRAIMNSEGLLFVGLHWLMMAPKGLHVTTPDEALRRRSWDHVRNLIDLCADLGGASASSSGRSGRTLNASARAAAASSSGDGSTGGCARGGVAGIAGAANAVSSKEGASRSVAVWPKPLGA